LARQQNLWVQKRTLLSRQDAKNAKESTLLFLKAIDNAGNPVFHDGLTEIE